MDDDIVRVYCHAIYADSYFISVLNYRIVHGIQSSETAIPLTFPAE